MQKKGCFNCTAECVSSSTKSRIERRKTWSSSHDQPSAAAAGVVEKTMSRHHERIDHGHRTYPGVIPYRTNSPIPNNQAVLIGETKGFGTSMTTGFSMQMSSILKVFCLFPQHREGKRARKALVNKSIS